MSPARVRPTDVEPYREKPRSYRSTAIVVVALIAGFLLDVALGGGGAHLVAWLAALVLIGGFDALTVRSLLQVRMITVTADRVQVGGHSLARADVVGVDVPAADDVVPIAPAPRGATVVGLRMRSGGVVGVPTRRPERLAAVLGFRAAPRLLDVRPATPDDLGLLPEVERRSDVVFAVAGIGPLPPAAPLRDFVTARVVFVAGSPPVGFARIELLEGQAHLEQLSVLPSHMRRGVGGSLVEAACAWALAEGFAQMTLCTFGDIAWNGPFYARHGFVELGPGDCTPGLVAQREHEVDLGLDALGRRVVMRRELHG